MFNKKTSLIAKADFIIASEKKMYLSTLNFQVYPIIIKPIDHNNLVKSLSIFEAALV